MGYYGGGRGEPGSIQEAYDAEQQAVADARRSAGYPAQGAYDVEYEREMQRVGDYGGNYVGLDRAIKNSPPPLDDVGSDVSEMLDENDPIRKLIAARAETHGSFTLNASFGQQLRKIFRDSPGWKVASNREREALDYLAGKLSRILSGRPDPQHWEDIAGYATLAGLPDLQS